MIKLLNKHLRTEGLFLIKVLPMVVILTLVILTHACKNSNNRIDKEIRAVANEVNKNCPKIINSELRLENVVPLSSRTLLYNFTFINKERSELDTLLLKSYTETSLINQFKTSPIMEYARQNKWTIQFYYNDKNGAYLYTITLTPEKYLIQE